MLYFQKMHHRLCRIATHCGCRERVVEDVYRTAAALAGLDSGVGLSSCARHEEVLKLRLDTTVDVTTLAPAPFKVYDPSKCITNDQANH
jgi:hypothetical protein